MQIIIIIICFYLLKKNPQDLKKDLNFTLNVFRIPRWQKFI